MLPAEFVRSGVKVEYVAEPVVRKVLLAEAGERAERLAEPLAALIVSLFTTLPEPEKAV